MNDLDNLDSAPRLNLLRLLPILLIALILSGEGLFAATNILPHWRSHETLASDLERAQAELEARNVPVDNGEIQVLQTQIESAQSKLVQASGIFLTPNQAERMLDRLYSHARTTGVEIMSLQSQHSTKIEADQLYEVRIIRLQVEGFVTNLMNFIIRIQEATLPGIHITNLALNQKAAAYTLVIDLLIYTSPYANGEAFANLPDADSVRLIPIIPTVPPAQVAMAPTPLPTLSFQSNEGPALTLVSEPATPEALLGTECPGAPSSLFVIGDTAVVDFTQGGALRILARARTDQGGIDTLTYAYDNEVLKLLDGPVCGEWRGQNIWYWYVEFKDVKGWAGEASSADRWLCPVADPECSERAPVTPQKSR